jgi:hypothetical protein
MCGIISPKYRHLPGKPRRTAGGSIKTQECRDWDSNKVPTKYKVDALNRSVRCRPMYCVLYELYSGWVI